MQRDYKGGSQFESLSRPTCNFNEGLKYQVPRRIWPKVDLCYGKPRNLARDGVFCQQANSDKCGANFEAQYKTNLDIVPKVSATGSIDSLISNPKMYIDVMVDLSVKWTTGVSVLAGASCDKHTETRYLPQEPQQISIGCFFPGCVVILVQGRVDLTLEGTLMAGARAVHKTEFTAKGNIRFAKGEDNPELTYAASCGNKRNCFQYPNDAKSGWRVDTWGEMWGQVGVKVGPVFTVMVTPGLWASVTPWVSAEASMYGSMAYSNLGGNVIISDQLFDQYASTQAKCNHGISVPVKKDMYTTTTKSSKSKVTKTNAQGQQKDESSSGKGGIFSVQGGDLDYCVAAALSFRVGVDMYGGLMPESFQGDATKSRNYVKDVVCGKATSRSRNLQEETASSFDQAFEDFMKPISSNDTSSSNTRMGDGELDVFKKCLKESGLEVPPPDGQPVTQFFNPFNPRKYCRWGVDKVFDVVQAKINSGEVEMLCRDFKYFTDDKCADKVGCKANLQLVPPADRPLPGNYWRSLFNQGALFLKKKTKKTKKKLCHDVWGTALNLLMWHLTRADLTQTNSAIHSTILPHKTHKPTHGSISP